MYNLEALKKGTYYEFKLTDGTFKYGTFIKEGLRRQPRYADTYAARTIVIENNGTRDVIFDTDIESVQHTNQHNGGYLKRKRINRRRKSTRGRKTTRGKKTTRGRKSTRRRR